ncbi:MAG: GTP cyclohydrolase I FolE [Candidatus Endonucleobacter bathymodioli]|uniref:GTP cyclohydrolase 1 n=1 Tax=Candidatus Endonucleibacter bathymodioli TaxID=539814 RepID=A0AA90NVS4_9GAMM|nr:GTP cyclohydrolase I FolE [Candidatus Endonucleobacter bathymodioli]
MTSTLSQYYKAIIETIGENIHRDGLKGTPDRAAETLQYLTHGYNQNIKDIVNGAVFESNISEMIVIKDIELYSLCEHHMLPFLGKCHIGYLPKGKVLGLSKFARIVDMFARRLQIQENLTHDIASAIMSSINAKGVAVVIEAQHMCMMMRGVEKQNSSMTTSVMLGLMRDRQATREEFLQFIKH